MAVQSDPSRITTSPTLTMSATSPTAATMTTKTVVPALPSPELRYDIVTLTRAQDPEVYAQVVLIENALKQAVEVDPNKLCATMSPLLDDYFQKCGVWQVLSGQSFNGALLGVFQKLANENRPEVAFRLAKVLPEILGYWLNYNPGSISIRVESALTAAFGKGTVERTLKESLPTLPMSPTTGDPTLIPRRPESSSPAPSSSQPTMPTEALPTPEAYPASPYVPPSPEVGPGPSDPGPIAPAPEEHFKLPESVGGQEIPYWAIGLAGVALVGGVYYFTKRSR